MNQPPLYQASQTHCEKVQQPNKKRNRQRQSDIYCFSHTSVPFIKTHTHFHWHNITVVITTFRCK